MNKPKDKMFKMGIPALQSKDTKLFLCGTDVNIQSYHDPKYEWLLEKADELDALSVWSKDELSLKREKVDYDSSSMSRQFIFDENLAFAIYLDSNAGRAPLELFVYGGKSSNPEVELYFTRHQKNETTHSASYAELLLASKNNIEEFLNKIPQNEAIIKRASIINNYINIACDIHDKYDANNICEEQGLEKPFPEIGEFERKKAIYLALIILNLFEGVMFFQTFALNWSLSEQPERKFEGSSEMFSLISRDEMNHLFTVQQLIYKLKTDPEEGFTEAVEACEPLVYEIYGGQRELERFWTDEHIFQYGEDLIGMNKKIMNDYMDYLFFLRLENIGYDPAELGWVHTNNPITWIDDYLDSTGVITASNEKNVSSYVAAINADEDDDDLDDFL